MEKSRPKTVEDLRTLMSETGLKIRPVAKTIGCSPRQVLRWLKGEAVPTAVYARLIDKAVKRLQGKRT